MRLPIRWQWCLAFALVVMAVLDTFWQHWFDAVVSLALGIGNACIARWREEEEHW